MIGWGVLGNATIARLAVVPAIERAGNGFLAAVGSRSGARAAALAQASGATAYDNYDAVLADPAVDIVYIPLPNHLHKPWTLKALAAGKHVLVEKPFALNATEARVMAAAAEAAPCTRTPGPARAAPGTSPLATARRLPRRAAPSRAHAGRGRGA